MIRLKIMLLVAFAWSVSAQAQKAVLIDDNAPATGSAQITPVEKNVDQPSSSESFDAPAGNSEDYVSAYSMRAHRRVGVGTEVLGELGLFGIFTELNFAADDSAVLGFGGGLQYSAFEANWKHVFGGKTIAPYTSLGIAHWYAGGGTGPIQNTVPAFLGDRFLSGAEMSGGRFGIDLLTPAAGFQYNLLSGEYAGSAFFAEILLPISLRSYTTAATGSVGAIYYF